MIIIFIEQELESSSEFDEDQRYSRSMELEPRKQTSSGHLTFSNGSSSSHGGGKKEPKKHSSSSNLTNGSGGSSKKEPKKQSSLGNLSSSSNGGTAGKKNAVARMLSSSDVN